MASAAGRSAVRVTMRQFLTRCGSDTHNLNVEREIDSSERMIRIQQHILAFKARNGDHRRVTILSRTEGIAHF